MSATKLIWSVVAIIVLLVVIGLVVRMGRRRNVEAHRTRANELREEGDRTRLQASEQDANAASADANARLARVEAEKLEQEADATGQDARESRIRAQRHHQLAAEIDPDRSGPREGAENGDERPKEGNSTDHERQ